MDGRRLLAFGGGVTVAVAVTVACTFAVSNAVELTDVAGEPVSGTPLLVPSSGPAAQTPTGTPSTPTPTATPTTKAPVAETVPAPEPRAVTPKSKTTKKPTSGKNETRDHPRKTPTPAQSSWQERREEVEALIAQYEKDGDWGKVKEWIAAQGWSREQADRWVRYIRANADRDSRDEWNRDSDRRGDGRRDDDAEISSFGTSQTPAHAGTVSGHDLPREWTGSKERTIDARFPVGRD